MSNKPDAVKAIAVAKDVIKQLNKLHLSSTYVSIRSDKHSLDEIEAKDLQEVIDEIQKKCQVCAMGAVFLSKIRLYNGVTTQNLLQYNTGYYRGYSPLLKPFLVESLKDCFTEENLDEIERSFELWNGPLDNTCYQFGIKYKTKKARLRAIMKNIIKNNGVFIP